ncbi:MAG: diguanylate cyclase [Pseudomonadales bacterium]
MLQLSLWSIPPLLAALVLSGAYVHLRGKEMVPGIHALRLLIACVLVWSAAEFLESIFVALNTKLLLATVRSIAITMIPVAWFAFALAYGQQRMYPNRAVLNVATIVPLTTALLIITNDYHHLMWSTQTLVETGGYIGMQVTHGSWFIVHSAYSYTLILISTTILTFSLSQSAESATPIVSVIAAPLVVGLANAFSISSLNPYPWFDLSTVGFAAASLILTEGVLRYGLLDHARVLRDQVVENLTDGVTVLNTKGQIIDANSKALSILSMERGDLGSSLINDIVTTMPLTNLNDRQKASVEITLEDRAFEVSSSTIDATSPGSEIVLVFRDVTIRRENERELRRMKNALETMAHTDALTKLYNRWVFMERLQEEVERVRRHGSTLSVLLFDLDHFKKVNDTFGHEAGDEVLKTVAKVATQIKRLTDVAARLGGEEFAILLPETQREGALHLAQRLREAIEEADTVSGDGKSLKVTASVGVATVTRTNKELEGILKHADTALYEAKESGRNMVCVAKNAR